ncbi:hypothetical protein HPB47_002394 [Ixodes persulcatus]|uniref:Uncharacterized protein n=1 Tax=Ixodes persulcatus TaxID=34615 RepID=A0AC60PM96_IXOPE|nr:hypothetical protein HPB47_002394 [Ixodes persulcatus]
MVATAVNQQGEVISSCCIKTSEPEVAEERLAASNPAVRQRKNLYSRAQGPGRPREDVNESTAHLDTGALVSPRQRDGIRLVTFRDILDHYTGERLRYPPAHPSLDKRTSVAWRRLQTGSFPSPSLLNKWYPDKYKPNCKLCSGHANLRHMVWECSRIDRKSHPLLEKIDNQESWETLLLCSDPSVQNQLVQLSEDAAKTQRVQAAV